MDEENQNSKKLDELIIKTRLLDNHDGTVSVSPVIISRERLPEKIKEKLISEEDCEVELSFVDKNELAKEVINTFLRE